MALGKRHQSGRISCRDEALDFGMLVRGQVGPLTDGFRVQRARFCADAADLGVGGFPHAGGG